MELTPEELTHLKLKRYDADHGRPLRPAVREFGSEYRSAEVVAIDPVASPCPFVTERRPARLAVTRGRRAPARQSRGRRVAAIGADAKRRSPMRKAIRLA